MPLKEYAADFDAPTFQRLEALLRQPQVCCVELTLPASGAPLAGSTALRDQLYANLTATLVRRSSLMLAVWDGQGSTLPGGTPIRCCATWGAHRQQPAGGGDPVRRGRRRVRNR